ncbi:MAG: metallophosphoesterase family protein [Chloroflexi bacterium]|nr:metallophosphoesterase family protein [Chloroflexota bacterium]
MRYGILADIHSNLAAFEAVLSDIGERGGVEEIWCLGDIVGYGPDPVECINLLRTYSCTCVAGNHDWAAIGKLDTSDFNPYAAAAAHWTARHLTPEAKAFLEELPLKLTVGDFTLVHGSPSDPIWEYLFSADGAEANLSSFDTSYCLVGHTHVPVVFECDADPPSCLEYDLPLEAPLKLAEKRLIINPGGVGQPRDGDERAAYAIYDADQNALHHYRVPYDIELTQRKMIRWGLPFSLAQRLGAGR